LRLRRRKEMQRLHFSRQWGKDFSMFKVYGVVLLNYSVKLKPISTYNNKQQKRNDGEIKKRVFLTLILYLWNDLLWQCSIYIWAFEMGSYHVHINRLFFGLKLKEW